LANNTNQVIGYSPLNTEGATNSKPRFSQEAGFFFYLSENYRADFCVQCEKYARSQTMSAITFDTLKFVERLEKAGMSREYAAALAEAQKDSLSEVMDAQLATKGDLAKMESTLQKEIQRLDYEIRLVRWMVGLSLALSTGILALLAKLAFTLPQ